ncbi:hypothetical protein HAQ00_02260 [Acidithiobacillus caldus ATCC 51756]|jgi:conjugal transfer pilus assembly protein TraB|uniref:TrbI/VirB10 family protein n=1 Tax=Acidithiobacillus caldus TaxID=33059 RepID=UPI001C07C4B6|nr:TrbI/VirB10 family protein [Acidithiobacillus caldus]MBU2734568.1 hypothetical protein [Acidithiobacillus caldus ATCC 51756]MBU2801313.1 hypothetical protein [Acidithiobacillus caldus]
MANSETPKKKNKKKEIALFLAVPAGIVGLIFVVALMTSGPGKPQQNSNQQATPAPTKKVDLGGLKPGSFGPLYQKRVGEEIQQRFERIESKQKAEIAALEAKEQAAQSQNTKILEQIERHQEALQSALQEHQHREREEQRTVHFFGGQTPSNGVANASAFTQTPAQAMATTARLEPTAAVSKKKKLVVPMGFVSGRLLNGVDATAGGVGGGVGATGTDFALIDLTGRVYEANNYHADLQHCLVLAQAFPDFSTSRVLMKPTKLQCNMPNGQSVSWSVAGFITHDGIEGVPGKVNENLKNEVVANTLLGAVGGVANTVGQSEYTNTYSAANGTGASLLTGNPYIAAASGSLDAGAQSAESALSNYFNLYQPSIQVPSDMKITVVITTSEPMPNSGRALTTNFSENG